VSSKPLAAYLQPRLAAGDRLVMLDNYLYDLPFYLRLEAPVIVASEDWSIPDPHDDTRKELQDTSTFANGSKGILIARDELARSACAAGQVTWEVSDASARERYPWLQGSEPVFRDRRHAIWRWPDACPPQP
jgi:hypothetical protein